MPGIFVLVVGAIILLFLLRLMFARKRNSNTSYQWQDTVGGKMTKEEFRKRMAETTAAKAGKSNTYSGKKGRQDSFKNPLMDPNNPNNPANPRSAFHPMNPNNPASPLNPNNPANPNSRLNPANRNNPLSVNNPNSPNYFGKKR